MTELRSLILVDDCRVEAMLVEEAVESHEAFGHFAHIQDSREACEQIGEAKPDAVLLDIRMPGHSGWEVLAQLRQCGILSEVYVAILSNSDSLADREAAENAGASAYFVKPFDPNGYIAILEKIALALA